MSVTRRLRFEILRRDNHTCTYCGAKAPDVVLAVDHVVPVALGGSDLPQNLTTACVDCNSGKSATPPDAPLVASVDETNRRWGVALRQAATQLEADRDYLQRCYAAVYDLWVTYMGNDSEMADGWETTVDYLLQARLPLEEVEDAVAITARAYRRDPWRYFAGVCWKKIDRMRDIAAALVESEDGG